MSSSLRSPARTDDSGELLRRFIEAARRAQIVTIVNQARTEAELGGLVTAELCEIFEAEFAFVLACSDGTPQMVGSYGLRPDEGARLLDHGFLDVTREAPRHDVGVDLLSISARAMVRAAFGDEAGRGVVGVGRIYDQGFDDAEAALLEAVAASIEPALERLRLAEERDRLFREAQERGQAARVIGSIADGVLLVDDAGIIQLWNPAAEAITGLSEEAVLGRPLDEAIPGWPAGAESVLVAGENAPSAGRATTVPMDVGGREVWLSISGVEFAEGTVYAFRDLTEDHRLEQLKADFIATVSHELRTPLAAVQGAAQTLNREDVIVGGDVFQQLLGLISEQSQRLSRMVEDILLASRVDSPALTVAAEQVDVRSLATEIVATARVHAGEALTLDLVAPPSLPMARADRDKLRQVLTNLVANAMKYSPGGGCVEVELQERDEHLAIFVRDEGIGIASADQRLIFEKFYRVDANMTHGVSGSGLGLYICRELLRRMGGRIAVQSKPGAGSTFVVTLPLVRAASRAGETSV